MKTLPREKGFLLKTSLSVASLARTRPNIKGLEEDTRAKLRFSIFFSLPSNVT